jgi:capsular exopolysaccharide synthesis family protein
VDFRGFFLAIRKRWWAVVLLTAIGAAAAVGITSRQAEQYRSSVTFFLSTPTAEPGQAYQASLYAQQLVNSYVKLLGSDELARRVIADAGLQASPQSVAAKISGTADLNTVLITARATDSTPAAARRLSTAVAAVFGPMVSSLNNNAASAGTPSIVLSVVSGPTNPVKIAPRRTLNYLLGILGGLIVGLAVAALRELLDTSIRSDEQVAATGVGVLASITQLQGKDVLPLMVGNLDHSFLAEEMRQLRTNLQYAQVDRPVRVIAVVSSEAGEGKSTVATNLALVFAEANRRTLLIDADLRKPRIADYLGLEGAVGLSDVLAQQVDLDAVIQPWGEQNLRVLTSGSPPPHPADLLGSRQMADLIARLRDDFDIIVIDTPPLLPVTDGVVTTLLADGAIVVVRNGRTKRAQLGETLQALRGVDASILGAVRNMVRQRRAGKSVYGDYVAAERSHSSREVEATETADAKEGQATPLRAVQAKDVAKASERPETDGRIKGPPRRPMVGGSEKRPAKSDHG